MTFEEAIIKKLQHDYKLLQLSCDGFKADRDRLAAELDRVTKGTWSKEIARLAAELAEAQLQVAELIAGKTTWDKVVENYERELAECNATDIAKLKHDVEFWKSTAERRGDEIKRLYEVESRLNAQIAEMIDANKWEEPKCDTQS